MRRLPRPLGLLPLIVLLLAAPAHAAGSAPARVAGGPRAKVRVVAGARFVRKVTAEENAKLHAVLKLEQRWLAATRAKEVAPLLASDFHHPSASGAMLDKAAYLKWFARRRQGHGLHRRFSLLQIRLLGPNVALVNGRVDLLDGNHRVRRSMFTDVLELAHGRWHAVSAQETPVVQGKRP